MSKAFWQQKSLQQMTQREWELLCDGCGRCCLLKLLDEDTDELFFTRVSCYLLDIESCRCQDYEHRKLRVPQCLQLRQMTEAEFQWLPASCAYRRLAEGRGLPRWHPLVSGDSNSVQAQGISIRGYALSEDHIHADELAQHIIELSDID